MSTDNVTSNIEIEKLVLGSILQQEDNYWSVQGTLSVDTFASEAHQRIFAVMQQLAMDSRAIRVPMLSGRLGGEVEGMGIEAYLSALLHKASREDDLPLLDFAEELRTIAMRRRIIELANNLIKTANDASITPDRIVERASERLADITNEAAASSESTVSATIKHII